MAGSRAFSCPRSDSIGWFSVLLGDVAGGGHQLVEHSRVGGGVISDDLTPGRLVVQSAGDKSPGGRQVPLLGDHHVDDLPNWSIARYRYTQANGDDDHIGREAEAREARPRW